MQDDSRADDRDELIVAPTDAEEEKSSSGSNLNDEDGSSSEYETETDSEGTPRPSTPPPLPWWLLHNNSRWEPDVPEVRDPKTKMLQGHRTSSLEALIVEVGAYDEPALDHYGEPNWDVPGTHVDGYPLDIAPFLLAAAPYLSVVAVTRAMKACWFLRQKMAEASELKELSFRALGSHRLPLRPAHSAPQMLRDKVALCRLRQHNWGKKAPQRAWGKPVDYTPFTPCLVNSAVTIACAQFTHVQTLNLRTCSVSNAAVGTALANLSQLTWLDLARTPIRGDLVDEFGASNNNNGGGGGASPSLTWLNLSRCSGVGPSINGLRSCPALQELDLSFTAVTDASSLRQCTNLTYLNIGHSSIAELQPWLSALRDLTCLDISTTLVIDLNPIARCGKLTRLDCSSSRVVGLGPLSVCSKLKTVNARACPIRYVDGLSFCPGLTRLDLSGTRVADITPLRKCFDLRMVDLGRTQVEDAHALSVLLPSCPKLRNLGSKQNVDLMRSLSPLHSAAALDAQVERSRVHFLLKSIQRRYRAKLAVRREAEAEALAAALERAEDAGSYDAFGNLVLLDNENLGGPVGDNNGDSSDKGDSDASSDSDSD